MKKLTEKRSIVIVILAVVAAVGAFLVSAVAGGGNLPIIGSDGPKPKVPVATISFTEPFLANLAGDGSQFVKMRLAVRLAPMTEEEHVIFEAGGEGGGGHGGGTVKPGPERVATDPQLRAAVTGVVMTFTRDELLTPKGRTRLETEILAAFEAVERENKPGKGVEHHNPADPPYDITAVYIEDLAVQ